MTGEITGIAGGIGSGKSVVSRICRLRGYYVYDCDRRARQIMDTSDEIRGLVRSLAGEKCITPEGAINRKELAGIFFREADVRREINARVHRAVREDILRERKSREGRIFVESAIMRSSGLVNILSDMWMVTAPMDVRIGRVVARNGMSPAEVMRRIASQRTDEDVKGLDIPVDVLDNSGEKSLLLQIDNLLKIK